MGSIQDGFPTLTSHYFDSATIGHSPKVAIDAQITYLQEVKTTIRKSIYKQSRLAEEQYFQIKEDLSKVFGGGESEYCYIPSIDVGSNIMIESLILGDKSTFYTTKFDNHSLISPLFRKRSEVISVDWGLNSIDSWGEKEVVEQLEQLQENKNFSPNNFVIVIGHISPIFGVYRPLKKIAEFSRDFGGILLADISMTVANHFLIDRNLPTPSENRYGSFDQLPHSIILCDGSKNALGPVNSGFAYISPEIEPDLPQVFPSAGNIATIDNQRVSPVSSIDRLEIGQPDIGAMKGLIAAIQYLQNFDGSKYIEPRTYFTKLQNLEGISLLQPKNNDETRFSASLATISTKMAAHDIALLLDEIYNVQIRSGLICTHQGLRELNIKDVLQISSHLYTTNEDYKALLDGLQALLH